MVKKTTFKKKQLHNLAKSYIINLSKFNLKMNGYGRYQNKKNFNQDNDSKYNYNMKWRMHYVTGKLY